MMRSNNSLPVTEVMAMYRNSPYNTLVGMNVNGLGNKVKVDINNNRWAINVANRVSLT